MYLSCVAKRSTAGGSIWPRRCRNPANLKKIDLQTPCTSWITVSNNVARPNNNRKVALTANFPRAEIVPLRDLQKSEISHLLPLNQRFEIKQRSIKTCERILIILCHLRKNNYLQLMAVAHWGKSLFFGLKKLFCPSVIWQLFFRNVWLICTD